MNLFQPAAEDKLKLYGLFKQAQDPSRSDPCCPAACICARRRKATTPPLLHGQSSGRRRRSGKPLGLRKGEASEQRSSSFLENMSKATVDVAPRLGRRTRGSRRKQSHGLHPGGLKLTIHFSRRLPIQGRGSALVRDGVQQLLCALPSRIEVTLPFAHV